MLTKREIKKLVKIAKNIRENAFAYRSDHKFGACILSQDGKYFGGCNIESDISGLGICAERAAIDHAVIHGKTNFKALAVVDEKINYPCGACLQYLSLFEQVDEDGLDIVVADLEGKIEIKKIDDLLPYRYKTTKISKIRKYTK